MSEKILEMIIGEEFNNFCGDKIVELLQNNRKYWSKIEVPDDIDIFGGTDTLFIYPAHSHSKDVTFLLAKALGADETSWDKESKYVRVWWD
jgi:hypothetical protein